MQHCPQTYQDRREAAGNNVHGSASIRLTNPALLELGKGCIAHNRSSMWSKGLSKKEGVVTSETEIKEIRITFSWHRANFKKVTFPKNNKGDS